MTEENQVVEVPETVPTAEAPAEQVENAEQPEPAPEKTDDDSSERVPKGVQKRIDRLTREKYEAKARADLLERMISQQQAPQSQQREADGRPQQSDYATAEDFVEALTDWKLQQRESAYKAAEQQKQQATIAEKRESLLAQAEELGDFDRDDFAANVVVTQVMAEAILESDMGAKIVLALNSSPQEAQRIANLPPARQAAEIGKLEAKLSTATVTKSAAPKPIQPLSGGGKQAQGLSDDLSAEEWVRMRNKQLRSR